MNFGPQAERPGKQRFLSAPARAADLAAGVSALSFVIRRDAGWAARH